jgi:hypothetical protein
MKMVVPLAAAPCGLELLAADLLLSFSSGTLLRDVSDVCTLAEQRKRSRTNVHPSNIRIGSDFCSETGYLEYIFHGFIQFLHSRVA